MVITIHNVIDGLHVWHGGMNLLGKEDAWDEYRMMKDFINALDNQKLQNELYRAIQGRGAFRRFKDKIYYEGIEQQWYDFQNNSYQEFVLRWCKENNIRCEMDE